MPKIPRYKTHHSFIGLNSGFICANRYLRFWNFRDSSKKIDYLKKMSKISPNDSYPLQQLVDIYSNEFGDVKQARNYQDKVNKIKKSF